MPLWGKTDTTADAPKYLSDSEDAPFGQKKSSVTLIDLTEAQEAPGVRTPGWTVYEERANGRVHIETLVAMRVSAADATPVDPEDEPQDP